MQIVACGYRIVEGGANTDLEKVATNRGAYSDAEAADCRNAEPRLNRRCVD